MKKIQFENEVSIASSSNGTASNISNRRSSSSSNKKLSCSSFSSSDDEPDDDDDDDDENGDSASQSKSKHSRPNTGKYDRKKSKQIKPSKDSENHVKNLRELQFKNKLLNTNNNNNNNNNQDVNTYENTGNTDNDYENATSASDLNLMLKTAVNRTSLEVESKSLLKNDLKLDLKLDLDDNDDDDDVLNSDESDDKPFANSRNISTVKVNQPRKPLEQTLNVSQKDNLTKVSRKSNESEQDKEQEDFDLRERAKSSSKVMSDREKRVSDLVNSIKQKQKQHEQKKQFYTDFKPYFIGSSLLLGGAILFQIYRSFFAKSL
jgi:hypothetical protein